MENFKRDRQHYLTREQIVECLKKHHGTAFSGGFPERGLWGSSKYRGNTTGWVIAYFIWLYQISKMGEIMAGSGTGSDVAFDMGINYIGADLNPNPVRSDIMTFNALTDDMSIFGDCDGIFMHPPYADMIPYTNNMYVADKAVEKNDLGHMDYETCMKALNYILGRTYSIMAPGAYCGVLVGDIRKNGVFRSMLHDMTIPGELQQIYSKIQYNTWSGRQTYSKGKYPYSPIETEYMIVFRKALQEFYMLTFDCTKKKELDIRDSIDAPWPAVTLATIRHLPRKVLNYSDIRNELKNHKKAQNTNTLDATIRRTCRILERRGFIEYVEDGKFKLAA